MDRLRPTLLGLVLVGAVHEAASISGISSVTSAYGHQRPPRLLFSIAVNSYVRQRCQG